MSDKIVDAVVTKPTFINNVLHYPGEMAKVDLDALGVKDLNAPNMSSLAAVGSKDAGAIEYVPVAPIAPHAPNPDAPQGIPPGTVISGTGRSLSPPDPEQDELAREMVAPSPPPPADSKKK